jgi:hypothetical protein
MPPGTPICTQCGASQPRLKRSFARGLLDNWIVIVLVLLFLVGLWSGPLTDSMRAARMRKAKDALISIASAEHVYMLSSPSKEYGSFQVLQETLNIAEGRTLYNMIPQYSLLWIPTSGTARSFTVLALPRDTRKGYLHTFAVTDDDVNDTLRYYDPSKGYDLYDIRAWHPIW